MKYNIILLQDNLNCKSTLITRRAICKYQKNGIETKDLLTIEMCTEFLFSGILNYSENQNKLCWHANKVLAFLVA